MLQKFWANLENKKKLNQIKNKINLIYELIYSEKYNLTEDAEQERFIRKISGTHNPIQLLESYIVVNRITKYSLPISEYGIADLKKELENIKLKLNSSSSNLQAQLQEAYLESEKAKMSCNLLIKQQHIISGKAAFDKDPYSFIGMIYKMERAGRSPISLPELEKLKSISDQLHKKHQKVEEMELEQKELNNEIEELTRLKEQIKKNSL